MPAPAGEQHMVKAALKLSTIIELLIAQCTAIVLAMTGNAYFSAPNPLPNPTLAAVQSAIDNLSKAQNDARAKTKGAATRRNLARQALVKLMNALCAYVQLVADSMPGQEADVILSAKMIVKAIGAHAPRVFAALHGPISGTAEIEAPVTEDRRSIFWQWSTDQKTWNDLPPTLKASTTVANLTPGTTYWFRYRVLTKDGLGDWSQVVSLLMR
jgi:hypothetical protein